MGCGVRGEGGIEGAVYVLVRGEGVVCLRCEGRM